MSEDVGRVDRQPLHLVERLVDRPEFFKVQEPTCCQGWRAVIDARNLMDGGEGVDLLRVLINEYGLGEFGNALPTYSGVYRDRHVVSSRVS